MAKLDEIQGLTGWRYCHLLAGSILASPQQAEAWLERETPPADCPHCEKCPADDGAYSLPCEPGCGYYAMYRREDVDKQLTAESPKQDWVLVKVSAIGETELHREGFRAERLRVDEIWVKPGTDGKPLTERYGVPVYEEERPCKSESESNELPASQGRSQFERALQNFMPPPAGPSPFRPPPLQSPSPSARNIARAQRDEALRVYSETIMQYLGRGEITFEQALRLLGEGP